MKSFVTVDERRKKNAIEYIQTLYRPMLIEIKEQKRSGNQNRYFHMLVGLISEHTGESAEIEKMRIKFHVLPLQEIHVRSAKFLYPISSADADKEQMTKMIEEAQITLMTLGVGYPNADFFGMEAA